MLLIEAVTVVCTLASATMFSDASRSSITGWVASASPVALPPTGWVRMVKWLKVP